MKFRCPALKKRHKIHVTAQVDDLREILHENSLLLWVKDSCFMVVTYFFLFFSRKMYCNSVTTMKYKSWGSVQKIAPFLQGGQGWQKTSVARPMLLLLVFCNPLPSSSGLWDTVSLDFITHLFQMCKVTWPFCWLQTRSPRGLILFHARSYHLLWRVQNFLLTTFFSAGA